MPTSNLTASDFVVVSADYLAALTSAVSNMRRSAHIVPGSPLVFTGDTRYLEMAEGAISRMGSKPLNEAIRLVDNDMETATRSDPVLLVIPPTLNEVQAVEAVNSAIRIAAQKWEDGLVGDAFYPQVLAKELAESGIALEPSGLKVLPSIPWDAPSYYSAQPLPESPKG